MRKSLKVIIGILMICLGIGLFSGCDKNSSSANKKMLKESDIGKNSVFRPYFHTSDGKFGTGTLFVLYMDEYDKSLMVTTGHLFESSGRNDEGIPKEEIPEYVQGIELYNILTYKYIRYGGSGIVIPDLEDADMDIAAFELENIDNISTFKLATEKPKKGDFIWMLGQVLEGKEVNQLLHRGVVKSYNDTEIEFVYDDSTISVIGTNGAPIVNNKGEVVGMKLSFERSDGELKGFGSSAESIRKVLENALEYKEKSKQ